MSILGSMSNSSGSMNGPIFHEFKKQASFFLKEKIKTARLALTDVTPAQLLAEEATNESPGGPDARTLKMISKAAFEVDDYWRIVEILHKRLVRFDRRNWRGSYKALIVVEHLLTHGPERVAEEFQTDRDVIREMENFQHIDEKGFNWGLNVRKKCERILKLLEKGPLLKEEREKARKISREIKGFGSFCLRTSSSGLDQENVTKPFGRCNSEFNSQEDFFSDQNENVTTKTETEKPELETLKRESYDTRVDAKENVAPSEGVLVESKPLLGEQNAELGNYVPMKDDHPFDETEHLTVVSLLSTAC
ncbi:hypothetical protein DH2020_006962 [Rehmannia glutinosa]|uniref:ENTH domain-containing protein n=1 Tax=Rehmannia glutinosa TaxID=99300 RepID=A0ABR0W5Z8_REHGL